MPHTLDAAGRITLLYEITALRTDAVEERISTALTLVTEALSLELGILSQIDGELYKIRQVYGPQTDIEKGQTFSLGQTYCQLTLQADEVISISNAQRSPYAHHPCMTDFGLQSYIGAVVFVRGERVGTLNFSSTCPRHVAFTQDDEHLVAMLARWVGVALENQLTEEERTESEARFRGAFNSAAIGMATVLPNGRLSEANESLCTMLGYTVEELQQLSFQDITHPDDLTTDLKKAQEMLAGRCQSYHTEKRYIHRSGKVVWIHLSVSVVRSQNGQVKYFVSQMQDITRRKAGEAQIYKLAYHDTMTGLYNRHYFFKYVPHQLMTSRLENRSSALLYLDLNGFKAINDTLGHQAGDELLKRVARRFKKNTRESDMLVRLGGDEFAVFLADTDLDSAQRVASRLAGSLEAPFYFSGVPCSVGASIGVVLVQDRVEIEALLKQADAAMYRAKTRRVPGFRAIELVQTQTDTLN